MSSISHGIYWRVVSENRQLKYSAMWLYVHIVFIYYVRTNECA